MNESFLWVYSWGQSVGMHGFCMSHEMLRHTLVPDGNFKSNIEKQMYRESLKNGLNCTLSQIYDAFLSFSPLFLHDSLALFHEEWNKKNQLRNYLRHLFQSRWAAIHRKEGGLSICFLTRAHTNTRTHGPLRQHLLWFLGPSRSGYSSASCPNFPAGCKSIAGFGEMIW